MTAYVFFFKQKTAYEMRISDWSSDVCSSDLNVPVLIAGMLLFGMGLTGLVTSLGGLFAVDIAPKKVAGAAMGVIGIFSYIGAAIQEQVSGVLVSAGMTMVNGHRVYDFGPAIWFWIGASVARSEEHTSELQSLMRISYAVFCLKKNKKKI